MNKKMNNKGFSLVELIIVIAIMAILIGVLAPAYLRYVEKSRKSTDADAIASIMNAMETVTLDPQYEAEVKDGVVISADFDSDGVLDLATTPTNGSDKLQEAMGEIIPDYTLKSNDWKGSVTAVTGSIGSGGTITFSITEDTDVTTVEDYSNSIKLKIESSGGTANTKTSGS